MRNHSLACLLLAACTSSGADDVPEIKSDLARDTSPELASGALAELVANNTAFAAALYREVSDQSGNLMMSPHSISTALAMTYAGARGATATQMASALQFVQPPEVLHAAMNALDLELAKRETEAPENELPFRLRNANSIWGQDGAELLAPFLDTLAVNYGAGLRVLDFATDPEGARERINGWVEERTNDKIQDLLPPGVIKDSTRLVLTNAIYFSAAWDEPFEPSATQDRPFHLAAETVSVPSMHQVADMPYAELAGAQAVAIPYDGGKLSMVVVVPEDLATFEATLTGPSIAAIADSLSEHSVTLTIPKFRFAAPLGLKDVLTSLGMIDAFVEGTADLSGIDGTHRLFVSDVLHKGFIGIDEKGTEAAAATAVVINTDSAPPPATLTVDRPFLFFIRDNPTGAILFLGRVVDPR